MKQILLITLGAILAVSAIVFGFTYTQVNQERLNLSADLQYRTRLLADSLKESIEPNIAGNSTTTLPRIVDKFADRERIVGMAVFNNRGVPLAASKEMPRGLIENPDFVFVALDKGEPSGLFENIDGAARYLFVLPLYERDAIVGALVTLQDAAYIDAVVTDIWNRNIIRLLVYIAVFSAAIVLLIRWALYKILKRFAESVKTARVNKTGKTPLGGPFFLKPLASEISKIHMSLAQARFAASEEARMRLEKLDSPWTAERLREFVKAHLKDRPIFVVSNLEPYMHRKIKNNIHYFVPPSGLVTALNPVMEACGGMWIARSYGDADRETSDKDGKIAVPPDDPKYMLKRVWLTDAQIKGYHTGFSNEGLWPLCLMVHTRPVFRANDWKEYVEVNNLFAASVLKEIENIREPFILVQDYHLSLLPGLLKKARPDAKVALFWHLPWPSPEQFSICPWRKEILKGLLGADIIGFHTQQFCNNFIDTVGKEVESLIDLERFAITHAEHTSVIKPFPLSINFTGGNATDVGADRTLLEDLGITTPLLGLGVDKMDYVKGIVERFQGIEQFLLSHPSYTNKFTFLQIAPLCRTDMEVYRNYEETVTAEAERINKAIGTGTWKPIVLVKKEYSHTQLTSLYRLTHVLLITSLHEGMNLVAKEFAAARNDEAGVLILSPFTGASRELKGALTINPYSTMQVAEAAATALTMSKTEQRQRMKSLRTTVRDYNIYRWAAEFIRAVADIG